MAEAGAPGVACPVAALPAVEVEDAETRGVDVPLGALPCAAASWACIDDDGWN